MQATTDNARDGIVGQWVTVPSVSGGRCAGRVVSTWRYGACDYVLIRSVDGSYHGVPAERVQAEGEGR